MPMRRLRQLRSEEDGFALIEVLVSALIVVLVTAAVVQTLTATGRASTEQRRRSQAFSVAQEDQARLRAMQISTLQQGLAPRTVNVDGATFSVTSTATYVSDKTGTTRCGSEGRADYVRIGSSVTWPTMHEGQAPVTIESILSPTSGSVDATSGGLAVTVKKSREPFAGFGIYGSGPASFSGATNSEGCVLFGGQPGGEYTITPSPPGAGWVNQDGEAPKPFKVSIAGGVTTAKELTYDQAGSLKALFSVRPRAGGTPVAANADAVVLTNPGMTTARTFGNPGGGLQPTIEATNLFPFKSGYNVYAGSCTPAIEALQPENAATSSVEVPIGGPAEVLVQLPALYLTVRKSNGTAAEQIAVGGARVTLTDRNCFKPAKETIKRVYKTTAIGSLGEVTKGIPTIERPGVPTGEYEVCASKGAQQVRATLVVKKIEGTSLTMDLGAGAALGECP